jgi:hypothetical protein
MPRPGFVPPPQIRRLRDLTRYRADLVGARCEEQITPFAGTVARLDEIPGISLAAAHVILAAVLGNAGAAKTGIFPGERYRRISRRRGSKRRKRGHIRQIEALGCKVTLRPAHRRTHRSMGTPRCCPGRCSSVIPAEVINSGRVPHRPGGQLMLARAGPRRSSPNARGDRQGCSRSPRRRRSPRVRGSAPPAHGSRIDRGFRNAQTVEITS